MPLVTASLLQKLAAKWQVIGLLIVAFARLMRRCEDARVLGAARQAAQLEICVRAAHMMVLQDIEEALEMAAPGSETDDHALGFLRALSVSFLAIIFVLRDIAARGLVEVSGWMLAREAFGGLPHLIAPNTQGLAWVRLDPD